MKKWGYIGIALLVVLLAIGALYYTSRPNSYDVGSCVTEAGGKATQVSCSTNGAYQIVSRVSDHSQCPDPNEPYAKLNGAVLCLKKQ